MSWFQKNFTLPARSRGSYLITDHVLSELPEIRDYKVGMLNLFVQHTSCALSLNENWDDDVRADMSDALDRIAPYDKKGNLYRHSAEGEDDMPVRLVPCSSGLRSWNRASCCDWLADLCLGSYQVCPYWCFGEYPHFQRPSGHGHLAGYLVPRVPYQPSLAQGCRDYSRPKGVTRSWAARTSMMDSLRVHSSFLRRYSSSCCSFWMSATSHRGWQSRNCK